MSTKLDYRYVYFNFDWNWIKDKEILHVGDEIMGALYILDKDGRIVKMWGYELITKEN